MQKTTEPGTQSGKSTAQLGAELGQKVKQFHAKLAAEPMPEVLNRTELQNRSMAALIDCVAAALFFLFTAIAGRLITGHTGGQLVTGVTAALSAAFLLLKDGLDGRSPGKRLVGLRVVRTGSPAPVDFITSAARNWPLALLYSGPMVTSFLPWLPGSTGIAMAATLSATALVLYEVYRVVVDRKEGARLGDILAHTRVVEE